MMTMDSFESEAKAWVEDIPTRGLASLITWSNSVRKQPLEGARKDIQVMVGTLLGNLLPPNKLLEAFEAIRPGIHQTNPSRENITSIEHALLYLQILEQELNVYEQIMQLSDAVDHDTFCIAVHRSLAALVDRQTLYYEHYLPIPEKEWLRTHRLFYISIERKIGSFTTPDRVYFAGKTLSITNLYCMALLMGCGRMNNLTPREILRVNKSLQDWSPLVGVSRKPMSDSDNQLVVDITSSSAPNFKRLFTPEGNSISCYLQVDKLIERLDITIANEIKRENDPANKKSAPVFGLEIQTLDSNSLKYLKSAWSEYIYREARIETNEEVQACIGLDSAFFYLCGGQTLHDFTGIKMELSIVYDDHEDASTIHKQRSGDIWSAFTSVPEGNLVTGDIPEEFNFQHYFPPKNTDKPNHSNLACNARMTDTSSKGCRLQWIEKPAKSPEVGDIVALCHNPSQGHWQVGQIAWKQTLNGELSTGVRLLSTRAIPIAVDVPLRLGRTDNCAPGMLFPPEDQMGTHAVTFLTTRLGLHAREYITISQKGIEEKIHLNRSLKSNNSFESYECAFVVKTPEIGLKRTR